MAFVKLIFPITFLLSFCTFAQHTNSNKTAKDDFYYQTAFTTAKSVIVLPVTINGVTKNFLFDTGAEVTLVQSDSTYGKMGKATGATKRSMKLGSELIERIEIGEAVFENVLTMNGDFAGLKEQIPNFGGLIGQSIISKASWRIDYVNQQITITNKKLELDSGVYVVKVDKKPFVVLTIEDKKYTALLDLGSSVAFTVPAGTKLAEQLLSKYAFKENEREIYTIGGLQTVLEKKGVLLSVNLLGVAFKDVATDLRQTSQMRIGNSFFKGRVLYIDNSTPKCLVGFTRSLAEVEGYESSR